MAATIDVSIRNTGFWSSYKKTFSNKNGDWVVSGLSPGRYKVAVYKEGFLAIDAQANSFRERAEFEIELGQGETAQVEAALTRGGVITGLIRDKDERPLARIRVSVFELEGKRSSRTATAATHLLRSAWTDDRGIYRLYGLRPGRYLVGASVVRNAYSWHVHPPAYYPNKTTPGEADLVEVKAGQVTARIDFALDQNAQSFSIAGAVRAQSGLSLANTKVALEEKEKRLQIEGVTDAQGHYEIDGLPPGQYSLSAKLESERFMDARREIVIGSDSLTEIDLVAAEKGILKGIFTWVETGQPPVAFDGKLWLEDVHDETRILNSQSDDSSGFRVPITQSGNYRWRFSKLPAHVYVKAILLNNQNLTLSPLPLKSEESLDGIEILLAQDGSGLEGQLSLPTGTNLTRQNSVVVIPVERASWSSQIYHRYAFISMEGGFRLDGLPPGQYYLLALPASSAHTETGRPLWAKIERLILREISRGAKQSPVTIKRKTLLKNLSLTLMKPVLLSIE